MYIILTSFGLLMFVALLALMALGIAVLFVKFRERKQPKTKEEKIWEHLKENHEDTSKNSSQ